MLRSYTTAALAFAVLVGSELVLTQQVEAQSGSRAQSSSRVQSGSRAQGGQIAQITEKRSIEERFWSYLQQSRYKNWAPAPGQNGDFYEGQSPHGAYLKMYLNRTAIAHPTDLPYSSIIVKENYGPDKKTVMAITVMYRSKGYDPQHNDWYWVKYNPDGTVAKAPPAMGSMPLAGKVKGCIKCHGDSDGDDLVFFND